MASEQRENELNRAITDLLDCQQQMDAADTLAAREIWRERRTIAREKVTSLFRRTTPEPPASEPHPDSVRMDWLEATAMVVIVDRTVSPLSPPNIPATREAIDATATDAAPTQEAP
jgi:hypothetical protein